MGGQDANQIINDKLNNLQYANYLCVIIDEITRYRREDTTDIKNDNEETKTVDSPVFYIPPNGEAIVYSSKPIMLKRNSTEYPLRSATVVTFDTHRDTYTRLSATIPVDDKTKITLRFHFMWRSGYWSLSFIKLEYTDSKNYNLFSYKELTAARNFSYHCTAETTFKNVTDSFELTFYDLQAQPDTKNGKFNDAYDCTPFITVPIWSGLFVVSFLTIVLAIGLNALGNIKITHGCENIKLKELCIAVGNE